MISGRRETVAFQSAELRNRVSAFQAVWLGKDLTAASLADVTSTSMERLENIGGRTLVQSKQT
jgi:hypothetical protein